MYAANGFPPLAKGEIPIDLNKNFFDGNRILGDGKTFEGFSLGLLAGFLIGALETYLYPNLNAYAMEYNAELPYMSLHIAFLLAFGALFGDIVGSFVKRRFGLPRGADVPLLDQWNFVLGALLFSFWFTDITIWMVLIMLLITPLVHRIANIIGHKLKVKKEPW
jgi:CDP-2,3-bis-(O-geranylgeranyl)-sn-glycerol synthase